jgi:hypothetical protein
MNQIIEYVYAARSAIICGSIERNASLTKDDDLRT